MKLFLLGLVTVIATASMASEIDSQQKIVPHNAQAYVLPIVASILGVSALYLGLNRRCVLGQKIKDEQMVIDQNVIEKKEDSLLAPTLERSIAFFTRAIGDRNFSSFKELLDEAPHLVNQTDEFGRSMLFFALQRSITEEQKRLIAQDNSTFKAPSVGKGLQEHIDLYRIYRDPFVRELLFKGAKFLPSTASAQKNPLAYIAQLHRSQDRFFLYSPFLMEKIARQFKSELALASEEVKAQALVNAFGAENMSLSKFLISGCSANPAVPASTETFYDSGYRSYPGDQHVYFYDWLRTQKNKTDPVSYLELVSRESQANSGVKNRLEELQEWLKERQDSVFRKRPNVYSDIMIRTE